jgi:chemotaxis protein CheX
MIHANALAKDSPIPPRSRGTIQAVPPEDMRQFTHSSVCKVFKVMLNREAVPAESPDSPVSGADADRTGTRDRIVGTIGFSGTVTGTVYLHLDLPFARSCTCELLGMSESELADMGDEALNDAIAEVTNMVAGGFKNHLCDCGFPCLLTLPSILRGTRFHIAPISSTTRYISHFRCGGDAIAVEIFIGNGEDAQPRRP